MSVRIRMKKMGRRHRPFFRICAMDTRAPRDGRPIEELGYYDPMVRDVDARASLNSERIDYWLSVGAQPSEKVAVLIRKYGTNGTHLEQQKTALERRAAQRRRPVTVQAASTKAPEPAPAAEATPDQQDQAPQEQPANDNSE